MGAASGEEYCEQAGEAEGLDAKHGMGVTSGDGYCGKVGEAERPNAKHGMGVASGNVLLWAGGGSRGAGC